MPDDIFPVDAGVAAFVTLVGLAAHMVEHVLLGERQNDKGPGIRLAPLLQHTCAHSTRAGVGSAASIWPVRAGDSLQ